jgi:hypothetical protein
MRGGGGLLEGCAVARASEPVGSKGRDKDKAALGARRRGIVVEGRENGVPVRAGTPGIAGAPLFPAIRRTEGLKPDVFRVPRATPPPVIAAAHRTDGKPPAIISNAKRLAARARRPRKNQGEIEGALPGGRERKERRLVRAFRPPLRPPPPRTPTTPNSKSRREFRLESRIIAYPRLREPSAFPPNVRADFS